VTIKPIIAELNLIITKNPNLYPVNNKKHFSKFSPSLPEERGPGGEFV